MNTTTTRAVSIKLPPLHEGRNGSGGQVVIANSPARFKVVVCGRRWGKTTLGVWLCVKCALEKNGRAWWVAPTYKIAMEGWVILRRLAFQLKSIAALKDIEIREGDKQVLFPGGGIIEIRSSDTEDSLRGAGLDLAVMDEAASQRESAWVEELRFALADKLGDAVFIGTPKGKNWLYRLFERGKKDGKVWASWRFSTEDNPFISDQEIEDLKIEYAGRPEVYAQEIEADFGVSQFLVYPQFDRELYMWKWGIPKFDSYYGGLDFGGDQIGAHKSACILFGYVGTLDIMLAIREFEEAGPNITERQNLWLAETESILKNRNRVNKVTAPIVWAADKSQMKYIDLMQKAGFIISKSKGGSGSVRSGTDLVASRLVEREIPANSSGLPSKMARLYYMPELKQFPHHMETYHNYEPSDDPEKVQRDNPVKVNDDLDDAIRYAVERKDAMVLGDPNELYKDQLFGVRHGR